MTGANKSKIPLARSTALLRRSQRATTPWRKAKNLFDCCLYWAPVTSFPLSAEQKHWLVSFLREFEVRSLRTANLEPEHFLLAASVRSLEGHASRGGLENRMPVLGAARLIRRDAGNAVPEPEAVIFHLPDGVVHCTSAILTLDKLPAKASRIEFLAGFGGLVAVFHPLEPVASSSIGLSVTEGMRQHIPLLANALSLFDVEQAASNLLGLKSQWLSRTKELFGEDLEADPAFSGIPFVLPLFESKDFLDQPSTERLKLLEAFPIYFRESPADGGVILAMQDVYEPIFLETLHDMKDQGRTRPTGEL